MGLPRDAGDTTMASEVRDSMNRLAGKVAIVTGGASGMGRATVMRFLAEGAKVLVADLNEANGAETLAVAKAQGHGDRIGFVRCDVAKESDVAAMVAEARSRFGGLDVAYLNAGVGGAFGPIAETSVEDWDYTFAVLTRSVFLGMKHASLAMKARGKGGVILVTASIAGMVGGGGSHAYSAAKAAVISLIENVAVELGPHRIRVNALRPGLVPTDLSRIFAEHAKVRANYESHMPLGRVGKVEEIAEAILFLASDRSSWITGQVLSIDGGHTLRGGPDVGLLLT